MRIALTLAAFGISASAMADVFGVYAEPVTNSAPSAYGFYDWIPYNADTCCRITALYDAMCERGHVCSSDYYPGSNFRQLNINGCATPAVRNALGHNGSASNQLAKVDMLNLYKSVRNFLDVTHVQIYPNEEGTLYPSWSSPLGRTVQFSFSTDNEIVEWSGFPNCCAGNVNLFGFFDSQKTTDTRVTSQLSSFFSSIGYSFSPSSSQEEVNDSQWRNDTARNEYGTLSYLEWSPIYFYWMADDRADYGSPGDLMSYEILENSRQMINHMSSSCYYFQPGAFAMTNKTRTATKTTRDSRRTYDVEYLKGWIDTYALESGEHSEYGIGPVAIDRGEPTEETTESDSDESECTAVRESYLNASDIGELIYAYVPWARGDWEYFSTRTYTGIMQDAESETKLDWGMLYERFITTTYRCSDCVERVMRRTARPTAFNVISKAPYIADDFGTMIQDTKTTNEVEPNYTVYVANKNIPADHFDSVTSRVYGVQRTITETALNYSGEEPDPTYTTNSAFANAVVLQSNVNAQIKSIAKGIVDVELTELEEAWDGGREFDVTLKGLNVSEILNRTYYEYDYQYVSGTKELVSVVTGEWRQVSYPVVEEGDWKYANDANGDDLNVWSKGEYSHWKIPATVTEVGGSPDSATIKRKADAPFAFGVNRFKFIGQ